MNHYFVGTLLFLLGFLTLVAGILRWEILIFTAQEDDFQRKDNGDAVFVRRKLAGFMGIVIGVIVMFYGDF